jgi:transcriptional regulator of heat shock response
MQLYLREPHLTTVSTPGMLLLMNLTSRQIKILKSSIEEYIATAEPIASEQLEKKYSLGISPATIRNEMATLSEAGFLRQPHTSAGRIPTPMALRYYVDHLMQEKHLSVADEVSSKEQIWDCRFNFDRLMRAASLALADRTKNLSIVATDAGDIYFAGVANILDTPEFFDIDVTRTVLTLLDQQSRLQQLFFDKNYGEDPVHVIFGADLGWPFFEPVGMAFTYFSAGNNRRGSLAVVGPCRLNFPYVVPTLRYFSHLVSEMNSNW